MHRPSRSIRYLNFREMLPRVVFAKRTCGLLRMSSARLLRHHDVKGRGAFSYSFCGQVAADSMAYRSHYRTNIAYGTVQPYSTSEAEEPQAKSKKRKTLEKIQQQHMRNIEKFDKAKVAKMKKKEHEMKHEIKAMRGSDGFLEFEEIDPPWKDREGPYKPRYLLDDANWLLRKSKKADLLIGGTSIFVCCAMGASVYFSDLPPI